MSVSFVSMTSRSARVSLSDQQKTLLLNDVVSELENAEIEKDVTVFEYQNLKVVAELRERVIKIMKQNEFRRLYPTLTTSKSVTRILQKVA
jgi:hypothetical protein